MTEICTAFDGFRRLASGTLPEVSVAARRAIDAGAPGPVLIYDDASGEVIDLGVRERGRPKLGVVAREVTLLPRHWDWLNAQPGGASVALRKLVEEARRANADKDRLRQKRDGAYRFMSAMAGDLPGFEEASRALFADDPTRFGALIAAWPDDVRTHVFQMAFEGN